jgi:2-polyprenyl-3-methyl-5-hydroxy-6-metoxy-1,4-benzoquinol methylase
MSWKTDNDREFKINPSIIKNYFDKTASLVFSEEASKLEEECLLKFIPEDKKLSVLDLGCGNGRWANVLKDRLVNYVGVDFSNTFIDQANERFNDTNISFHCMSAQEYIQDEKFDIIFIVGLMTYLNDVEIVRMVSNLNKMLETGGKLIVRNVTLGEKETRKVYNRKLNFLEKLLGRKYYQLIRRTPEEEIQFFKDYELEEKGRIKDTGYIYYVFK